MNIKDFIKATREFDLEFMPIAPLGEVVIDEKELASFPEELPIIALKNTVLFPNVVLPINASRNKSVKAFEAASKGNGLVGVVTQKELSNDEPDSTDLYQVGTIARIVKQVNMPGGNTAFFILGRTRFEVNEYLTEEPFFKAKVTYLKDVEPADKDNKHYIAQIASIKEMAENIIQLSPNLPPEASLMLNNIDSNIFLINYIANNLDCPIVAKQDLLEESDITKRANKLIVLMQNELQIAEIKNEINVKTKGELDKQQREYFLMQQMKSIREELEGTPGNVELNELKSRALNKKWPDHAKEAFEKGLEKLDKTHPQAPDFPVQYNHLSLLLDLPWDEVTMDDYDLKKAARILDKDHFGLEKVKDRILEYLAVLKIKGDLKSPILCFVGPPGIGKTSLGQSIAHAINRNYVRISLGGLHDESELRGHRKTYIGAMPGRIIQSIKKAKSSNPVFILDEIEKMGSDFRGDPSSALLEILDPEQNNSFYDNYLEMEYDLSKVMFIATANSINDIQPALRDRLEIIQLSGYSLEEKQEIAKKHLVPKQIKAHGLEKYKIKFQKSALTLLIQSYTRESGVRELDRNIAAIMRYIAKKIALEEKFDASISQDMVKEALGNTKYSYDIYHKNLPIGVAVGLAWTYLGGEILFIETSLNKGKGELSLTGNLGNVMKESAKTALSYIKAHADHLSIDITQFAETDLHIHVPEGAIPKDGPSAGVTMLTALASSLSGRKVKPYLAMSGEITLRGQVLPVGGIKEKILAAKRAGLKSIMLCSQNKKDVEEIKTEYIKGLRFHYVNTMDEVLEFALMK